MISADTHEVYVERFPFAWIDLDRVRREAATADSPGYLGRETLRILDSLNLSKDQRDMIDYKNLEAVTGVTLVK